MQGRAGVFYPLALLAGLAFAAYAPSLSGDFLLDDENYILRNAILESPASWPRVLYDPAALTADPSQAVMMYRPLTALSFAVNRFVGGGNPFWYHLAAVLLHAANTCLVFVLALRLLPSGSGGGRAPWPALGAALLFCLHPAQAESVAYISGSRATLLSMLFCLVAYLTYEGHRTGSVAAFALALLSKESAVFLLPVLAAHDAAFGSRGEGWSRRARRWAPYAAVFASYVLARRLALGRFAQRGLWGEGWGEHLGLAVHGLFQDLAIALWPASLRACYSFPVGPGFAAAAALMGLALAALCAAAVYGLRRRRTGGFGLAWFLAGLLPVSNLVPVDALAADRFLYAPLAGLAFVWGGALQGVRPAAAALASGAMALLLGLRCLERQMAWQSGFLLDLEARASAPQDACTALDLASHYYNWGDLGRVEQLLSEAVSPSAAPQVRQSALMTMALARMRAGRLREAIAYLDTALALNPRQEGLHRLLGLCALGLGDTRRAAEEFRLEERLAGPSP